jgi:hypothetical protein
MHFIMDTLTPAERYKLLVNTITPRPIAWVVTQDAAGHRNAAPYSFFNAMGGTPPLVCVGMAADAQRPGVAEKDSLRDPRDGRIRHCAGGRAAGRGDECDRRGRAAGD